MDQRMTSNSSFAFIVLAESPISLSPRAKNISIWPPAQKKSREPRECNTRRADAGTRVERLGITNPTNLRILKVLPAVPLPQSQTIHNVSRDRVWWPNVLACKLVPGPLGKAGNTSHRAVNASAVSNHFVVATPCLRRKCQELREEALTQHLSTHRSYFALGLGPHALDALAPFKVRI